MTDEERGIGTRDVVRRGRARAAFQRHHLLPLALGRRPQIGAFLAMLGDSGFSLHDPARNSLRLPADERLALHRGPHPRYSEIVADRVERIRRWHVTAQEEVDALPAPLLRHVAAARLWRLQRVLVRLLAGRGPRLLHLNRRDPMRLFTDYGALDSAIDALYAAPVAISPDSARRDPLLPRDIQR